MVDYLETYIYTAGALTIVVLTIEVRATASKRLFVVDLIDSRWSESCLTCVSAALRHGVRHVFIQRDPVTMATPSLPRRTAVKCICTAIIYVSHRSRDITLYTRDVCL